MQLVRKTQKEWECSYCGDKINIGSSMFRKHVNKWVPSLIYCFECAKPEIEEGVKQLQKTFDMFKKNKSTDPMSAYMVFKEDLECYKNFLSIIEKN